MVTALSEMLKLGLHLPFVRSTSNNTPPLTPLPIPASEAMETAPVAGAGAAEAPATEEGNNAFVSAPAKSPVSSKTKARKLPDN